MKGMHCILVMSAKEVCLMVSDDRCKDDMETDYFALGITQLRGDDIGWFGGILVMYLFRHAEGRKRGAELSGGHFIGHLAAYFGLVSDQGLRDLSVVC
ncbi:hypothetical protein Tco_1562100 [Tanacetum coccineum]